MAPPPKIAPSVGKAIQTARQEKELSQKDLAQKVNEKPSVISDYEGGRAIPSPQILGKLERTLGVKLRGEYPSFLLVMVVESRRARYEDSCVNLLFVPFTGSNIGEKLGGPKKS